MTTPNDRPIPLFYLYADGQRALARGVWIPEEARPHRANVVFDKAQFEKPLPHLDPTIVHEDGDGSVTILPPLGYSPVRAPLCVGYR